MFYNIIKNFFLKKNVTKRLATQNALASNDKVVTVGILVDESYFSETAQLVERIALRKTNISVGIIQYYGYVDRTQNIEV